MRLSLIIFIAFAAFGTTLRAQTLDRVTLKAGYNLRETPSLKRRANGESNVRRVNRRDVVVTVLKRVPATGPTQFAQVCIGVGTSGAACKGGERAWTHASAITKPRVSATFDVKPPTAAKLGEAQSDAKTTAGCKTCGEPQRGIKAAIKPILQTTAVDAKLMATDGFDLPKADFTRGCRKFITKDGLGPLGEHAVAAAHRVAPDCMFERNFFGSMCPNYKDLTPPQKNAMVALTFASISRIETTSCNPKAQAKGKNDIADGLYQLEFSAEQRADARRSKTWCKSDRPVDTQDLTFQNECAVSTIQDTVCKWQAYIFDPRGYWEKLRHQNEITQLIERTARGWGLCKGN